MFLFRKKSPQPQPLDAISAPTPLYIPDEDESAPAPQPEPLAAAVPTSEPVSVGARPEKPSKNASAKAKRFALNAADDKRNAGHDEAWRAGKEGRPVQVFIGYLENSSKPQAAKYASGVAERNAVNVTNAAYAVFPWNGGWAYEVHEGGPQRAYLPRILRFFDTYPQDARLDDQVALIATGRRAVQVRRTQQGLVSLQMPESFQEEQTAWLEPGAKLKPAVSVRMGVLAAGAAIFATGFLFMLTSLIMRPEPASLPTASAHKGMRFNDLPISQWPGLMQAVNSAEEGTYVEALEYGNGRWGVRKSSPQPKAPEAPPALPPPLPRSK